MLAGCVFSVLPSAKVTPSAVRLRTGLPRMLERDSLPSTSAPVNSDSIASRKRVSLVLTWRGHPYTGQVESAGRPVQEHTSASRGLQQDGQDHLQSTLDGDGGNLLSGPHAFGGNPDSCGSWTLAWPGDALTGGALAALVEGDSAIGSGDRGG